MKNLPRLVKTLMIVAFAILISGLQPATAAAQETSTPAKLSFEVASIKPSEADVHMVRIGISPGGRWSGSGVTLKMLIQQAYDVKEYQISGLPGWASTDRYDINAKAENPNPTREQTREMLQSMLEERFKLKLHRETKEMPIYALIVGKDGHKMKLSEVQPPAEGAKANEPKPGVSVSGGGVSHGAGSGGGGAVGVAGGGVRLAGGGDVVGLKPGQAMMRMGGGNLSATGVPVSSLINMLAQQLGRPVVDKTGIKGNYDFDLNWTPEVGVHGGMALGAEAAPPSATSSGPSIFTAVQEQLGLKLESEKGPVENLVVDSVAKPSGN